MSQSTGNIGRASLLPAGARAFLRRRLDESVGLALCVGALLFLVALVSFRPEDPSFNRAAEGVPRNLMGGPGATAAVLAVQIL